jgi:hypothetical protein
MHVCMYESRQIDRLQQALTIAHLRLQLLCVSLPPNNHLVIIVAYYLAITL